MNNGSEHATWLARHQVRAVELVDRYWHQRAVAGIPSRSQIDPGEIQDALEFAFIAEHLSGGIARMRVAGGSIISVMGMEVAGMPVSTLVCPSGRDAFNEALLKVVQSPCKATLALNAAPKYGQPELSAEIRLYPLKDWRGNITQILGTFTSIGKIGRTPRRFHVTHCAFSDIKRHTPLGLVPLHQKGHLSLVVSN